MTFSSACATCTGVCMYFVQAHNRLHFGSTVNLHQSKIYCLYFYSCLYVLLRREEQICVWLVSCFVYPYGGFGWWGTLACQAFDAFAVLLQRSYPWAGVRVINNDYVLCGSVFALVFGKPLLPLYRYACCLCFLFGSPYHLCRIVLCKVMYATLIIILLMPELYLYIIIYVTGLDGSV